MTIHLGALAGASLVALALAGTAAAQTSPTIIVTGTHLTQEVRETPGGADLVSSQEFENRLAVSLRDTLAFSPGVYAQPRFAQEVRLSIRGSGISRGFHMRGLTLLQDGIPINLADDNGDFQELDPLVFEHIEVLRGANALSLGGSTLGGAINAVTPTGRTRPSIGLRLDGGSFETVRGMISGGFAGEDLDGWAAITGDRSDGDRDHAKRRSLRFNGNVGLHLGERVRTRFYASAQTIDQELPGALTLGAVLDDPSSGNFTGDQQRDVDSLRVQNRTSFRLGKDTALDVGAFLNLKHLSHPIFQVVDQDSTDYGAYARLGWQRGPVGLTLGTTARFGTTDSQRFVNVGGRKGAQTLQADQDARTVNIYGEARAEAATGLTLIAGAIYTDGSRKQAQILPALVSSKASFTELSPKLGLLYAPAPDIQVYANYSRSHELPGFGELAQVAAFVPLDAQRAWTMEVGTRGRRGIASWDISLYRATVKGELLQFTVGPDIPASTFNADKTRHRGIEAGLDLTFTPWARLRQVYQFNDFRFVGDPQYGDNRLPVVPRHLYRAELRIGTDRLSVSPRVEWVPEGAWADYVNSVKVDGYALLGLTAEAEVREGVSLFLDARNITAEKAVGDISAVVQATDASAIYYPAERRALYGGIRASF